jgi:cyclomaltodextrinase / maltogenic alpha-amylase / neopullulanase
MTYVGAPMVYYGDEVGMWGGNDPDSRKPMVWSDLRYSDEVYNTDGTTHAPDKVEINQPLFEHYKKLIHIRKENPALQMGTYKLLLADDEKDLLVFERSYQGESIVVVINNNAQETEVQVPELKGKCFKDLLSANEFKPNGKIALAGKWGLILASCP